MHVFVSYSRRDRDLVARIVDRLEASGHDVWIDTDDIVGSDRWRASVAEAITVAEVVVLMVSPASMSSASVEREITLAAEEERRIIPVEIEPAEVAVGLQYDLAGIQRITFVGRPFEDALADLLAAVTDASPPPARRVGSRAKSVTTPIRVDPSAAPRRSGRRGKAGRVVASVTIAGLALVALRLFDGEAAPSDADLTSTSSTSSTELPAAIDVTLDATVWFAGYVVEASRVRLDPAGGKVSIDVLFTNDQYATGDPCPLLLEDIALVVDGQRTMLRAAVPCTRLTPGTSTRTTLEATVAAPTGSAADLSDATVELGAPDQHRAIIPLDGRPATSAFPESIAVSGTVTGEFTSFTVETVEVVPARCSIWTPLAYPPGRSDEMSIVVSGTASSTSPYPTGYGKARLTLPNGTQLASTSLAGVIHVLDPGVPERDVRACFVVPTPVAGEYRFTAAADGGEPFPEPITFTL